MEPSCEQFLRDPLRDPDSLEMLSLEDSRYKQLVKDCKLPTLVETIQNLHCSSFLKNKEGINSISGDPITPDELITFNQRCGFSEPEIPPTDELFQTASEPLTDCKVYSEGDRSGEIIPDSLSGYGPSCRVYEFSPDYWKSVRLWMISQYLYINRLTPEDQEILFSYNAGLSFTYNKIMRGQDTLCSLNKSLKSLDSTEVEDRMQKIFSIIMNAPRTPRMIVFRGENVNPELTDNYLVQSTTYLAKSFLSTTLDENVANRYGVGKRKASRQSAFLQIELPKGTPAIFIAGKHYPSLDSRVEIVLPPCELSFQGTLDKWGGSINRSLPTSLKSHPVCYMFRFQTSLPELEFGNIKGKPLIQQVIKEFADFFKTNRLNKFKEYSWVVKGGYGINALLKEKYGITNVHPTYDLDMGVHYNSDKYTQDQISNWIRPKIETFVNNIRKEHKLGDDEFYVREFDIGGVHVFGIKYKYCTNRDEGIIDVGVDGIKGGLDKSDVLDRETSEKIGLPIKTENQYFKELKDLIQRENIAGLDPVTFRRRNLKSTVKGKKTLRRTQLLCEMTDKAGRTPEEYQTMCNILGALSLQSLVNSSKDDVSRLFQDLSITPPKPKQDIEPLRRAIANRQFCLELFRSKNQTKAFQMIDDNVVQLDPSLLLDTIDVNPDIANVLSPLIDRMINRKITLDSSILNQLMIKRPSKEITELFIDKGISPDVDVLNSAIFYNTIEDLIRLLIDKQNIIPNTETLEYALENKYQDNLLTYLLTKGAKPDARVIHRALDLKRSTDILSQLINAIDNTDTRILNKAIRLKVPIVLIEALFKKGSKPDSISLQLAEQHLYDVNLFKTLKDNKPILHLLPKDFSLYAAKDYKLGPEILNYTRDNQKRTGEMCLLDNLTWLADLKQAKQYKKKGSSIFKWNTTDRIKLVSISSENRTYFDRLFRDTLKSNFNTLNVDLSKIPEEHLSHPYFSMKPNEQALFLFQFAFGYLPLEDQAKFIKLLYDLIQKEAVGLSGRKGGSILAGLKTFIDYYKDADEKHRNYPLNRISFYEIDRMAVLNLCMLSDIDELEGIFVPQQKSFWFSNTEKEDPMDLLEYALFRPHEKLIYIGKYK